MELKQALTHLEKDKNYTGWKSLHPDSFFSYALKIMDSDRDLPWQLGFYNPKTDKMVTFVMGTDIEMQPEEEIIKEPHTRVEPIETRKIKLTFNEMLAHSANFQMKSYPKEIIIKKIAILQNINSLGTIWNLTFISEAYNALHIKMDASSAKVLQHSCESLMNFAKKQ